MRHRRTLAASVRLKGRGLHTGESTAVSIQPSPSEKGVRFRFGERTYRASEAKRADAQRNTTIVFPGGERLSTVEHLMAALAGMEVHDAIVGVCGSELPALDGSARDYVERFLEAGIVEKDEPYVAPFLPTPICIESGCAALAALPSDVLRVTYVIDYPGTAIGTEMKEAAITPEVFSKEIAPARTFALLSEVEALLGSGLAKGGALENTIVVGEDRLLNEDGYRVEQECAAHKVLDLLGDLALAGDIPRAHYVCICGGHKLHAVLAARLAFF